MILYESLLLQKRGGPLEICGFPKVKIGELADGVVSERTGKRGRLCLLYKSRSLFPFSSVYGEKKKL